MIKIFFKGLAMGCADVVPGVSGGTLALILDIYPRLIAAIHSIKPSTIVDLLKNLSLWKKASRDEALRIVKSFDGIFLAVLGLGVMTAIVIGSKIIPPLIINHTAVLLSCFLGFIIPSIAVPYFMIKKFRPQHILSLAAGIALVVGTSMWMKYNGSLLGQADTLGMTALSLFVCGLIAICAMILPGISGSYLLIMLGQYFFVTSLLSRITYELTGRVNPEKQEALKSVAMYSIGETLLLIVVFAMGCLFGLALFSRVLNLALKKCHDGMMSALTGMLVGSLYVLWPFKIEPSDSALLSLGKIKWLPLAHNGLPNGNELWPAAVTFGISLALSFFLLKSGKAFDGESSVI